VARDGRHTPIEDCASPIVDEHGRTTGVVLVFRDMTQHRQAEEAETLRTLYARIDEAVRGANLPVWVPESPGGEQRRGRNRMRDMGEHLGSPPREDADVETASSLLHPDDRAAVAEARTRYLRGDSPSYEVQYRMRHADGSYRTFLSRGVATRDAR